MSSEKYAAKNLPLVTIIIPVYNSEKTIQRCLTSIRNQSYKNYEVLMVNDGSTDHSLSVLEHFALCYPHFHFINKDNSGVSECRNIALLKAKGKYIQFVDSDDWIPKNATEYFVAAAESTGADMVISDFYRVINHTITHKGHISAVGLISRKEYAEFMMKAPANFYYGVLWNKFFRRDLIQQNGLLCPTSLDWCEDFQFNMEYLQYAQNIFVLQKPLYYYVKTKGSLVDTKIDLPTTIRTKKILFEYYKDLYQSLDLYENNKLRIRTFFMDFARDRTRKTSV
ncbi:glycosyltransferase [Lachnospiraceae bacterium OttesenSCG-928-D06]|nr:glycosyltransferase [Lachnospiraceae bacterium OttesenSCG-928-D06]